MSDSVRPHRRQPTRVPCPWDSPGKNTGVGCHFLLQCMQVKSENEVTQSCPTLATPWTTAYQAPPSMGFSRQKYWSGVPLPSPHSSILTRKKKHIYIYTHTHTGFLGVSEVKILPAMQVTWKCGLNPWVGKICWRRKWQPTLVFLPRKSHGEKNLGGCSPWGCKELDITEGLSIYTHTMHV